MMFNVLIVNLVLLIICGAVLVYFKEFIPLNISFYLSMFSVFLILLFCALSVITMYMEFPVLFIFIICVLICAKFLSHYN